VERRIAVDLAAVRTVERGDHLVTLAWGDRVEVTGETDRHVLVKVTVSRELPDRSRQPVVVEGRITKRSGGPVVAPPGQVKVLRVDFVDVQQGDAAVIETPRGKVVLVDGGENQLFARYLAARYRGTSDNRPKRVDCIVVSHGDADHFAGLSEIRDSEEHDVSTKRLFLHPERVFHNGLVKRPSTPRRPDAEQLGETDGDSDRPLIVGLVDDPADLPDGELNEPFKRWKATVEHWRGRGPIDVRRLERGDDDAFDFLREEDVEVEVLGPILETRGANRGLPFLGQPRRRFGHPSRQPQTSFGRPSASHTINGHSIVLRLRFGRWRMLFAGDLNEEAERTLADEHEAGRLDLQSEVLKVPHHGSADFLFDFLEAIAPVVSVVSSGDEDLRREHIHPRATLMAGLGRFGRDHEPVIFVTELVAFFKSERWVNHVTPEGVQRDWSKRKTPFFAFSREAFGAVHVRTDGERLLVYTDSGLADTKEAYAYTLGDDGVALPEELRRA
jgi:beta-lactamase superfamily II metal-dependent hydrolase